MASTNKFGLRLISFYSLEMVAEEGLREVITRWDCALPLRDNIIIVLFIERDEITDPVWHIS